MNRPRTLGVIVALVMAAAGSSFALVAPVSLRSGPDEPQAPAAASAEPSPQPTDDPGDIGDEDEDADETPGDDVEDVDLSPEPHHTDEPAESSEPEPTDAIDDDASPSPEAGDHEEGDHEGADNDDVDHHDAGTIVSFDPESGLLTVDGRTARTSGVVTSETELEWESRSEGPGRCNGTETATTDDLRPGTRVSELTFIDDEHLEEVALICPTESVDT